MVEMLKAKIHRATVTDAKLHYEGSITISRDLLDAAGMYVYQKVSVVDINNGNRFETYILDTKEPGIICLNGAAARKVSIGDLIIIMTFEQVNEERAAFYSPTVVQVDARNRIITRPPEEHV